jgi:hypothetical protein
MNLSVIIIFKEKGEKVWMQSMHRLYKILHCDTPQTVTMSFTETDLDKTLSCQSWMVTEGTTDGQLLLRLLGDFEE